MKKSARFCIVALFFVLSGTVSCRPEGIIPPDVMESLFTDFYRADALIDLANEQHSDAPVRVDSLRVYLPVIERQGYTKEEFRTSMDYYLRHPDDLSKIFSRVKARLDNEAKAAGKRISLEDLEREEEAVEEEERPSEGSEPQIERAEDTTQVRGVRKDRPVKRKKVSKKELKQLEEELK